MYTRKKPEWPTYGMQSNLKSNHFYYSDSTEIDYTIATVHNSLLYSSVFSANWLKDLSDSTYEDVRYLL